MSKRKFTRYAIRGGMQGVGWAVMAALVLLAFDHAMHVDRENLCSNDATAYEECRR